MHRWVKRRKEIGYPYHIAFARDPDISDSLSGLSIDRNAHPSFHERSGYFG